jgi:cyanobactin biosynthesis protein (PatB/AcyB/McaB family)
MATDSLLPKQVAPVDRAETVQPHQAIDLVNGRPDDLFYVRLALLHGANYNDPAAFDFGAALRHQGHVMTPRRGFDSSRRFGACDVLRCPGPFFY